MSNPSPSPTALPGGPAADPNGLSGTLEPGMAARIATAPISWGVCEVPGWGHQLPVDRVLQEMRTLGFTHTELGSAGWLPEDAESLRARLTGHDLDLLAAFIPLVLHRPAEAGLARRHAQEAARLLADVGARYFNTAPVTTWDWGPRHELDEADWQHLYRMLDEVEELCRAHGLEQVIHEHEGCVIETADEVQRLLDHTPVSLVLDTGHLALGGLDPLSLARDHTDRVGLVHLKDLDLAVADRFRAENLSLMEAVQAGLFPALGQGDLPIADIVTALERNGYQGWYVIEQDCALTGDLPVEGEGPMLDVAVSNRYIAANIGVLSDVVA